MLPGTANTSRFWAKAWPAVMREPLRRVPSTTTTPLLRPEMTRLRMGKWNRTGCSPGGNSVTTAPPYRTINSSSWAFSGG